MKKKQSKLNLNDFFARKSINLYFFFNFVNKMNFLKKENFEYKHNELELSVLLFN